MDYGRSSLSAIHIVVIILSVLIVTAQGIAAVPLSFGILLNNNNSIKLANKNVPGLEQKVSHKLGRRDEVGATGSSSSGSNNNNNNNNNKKNNIKSFKKILNNKLKVSHEFSGGRSGVVVSKMRFNIAIIKPTFTAAAYSNSFYKFYILFMHTPPGKNVTTDLNLLSSKIPKQLTPTSSAFTMLFLSHYLKTLLPQSNIDTLTDADVDGSSGPSDIFVKNGLDNKYNVLVLGHQEYVTQKEYDNLKRFVANGGTLIALDGDLFHAEVKYDKRTQTVTLVEGHGWTFNGKSAWKSVNERWKKDTSFWVGSNYLCYSCKVIFLNNPFGYKHHEEQYLTNKKDVILMNYDADLLLQSYHPPIAKPVVAAYELNYQKGKVIVLGLYSDDIIFNGKFDKFFDRLLLQDALTQR
ncbi:MAG: hypothetical protein JO297_17160 [Nitrososphaeraceae archaeon]|nr:hypothetical protein [Nitrososphaeraceae archaeon]